MPIKDPPSVQQDLSRYKLAAIDLDGTLLDIDTQISQANLAAIKKLKDRNIIIILASGRNEHTMAKFQQQLQISGPIVSHHGALVKIPKTNEIIFSKLLTKTAVKKVISEANKYDATVVCYHESGMFTTKENELTAYFNKHSPKPLNLVDTFASLEGELPYKIIWMHEAGVLSKLHNNFEPAFTTDLYIIRNQKEFLEFISPDTNKAVGLQAVSQYLGVGREEIVSFGDADNDVPMLSWAGLGIAMNHATKSAKEAADVIAPDGDPDTCFARAVDSIFI